MNYSETHPLVRQCAILQVLSDGKVRTLGELHDAVERMGDDELTRAVVDWAMYCGGWQR